MNKTTMTITERRPNRYSIVFDSPDGEILAKVSVFQAARQDLRGADEKKSEALRKTKALARALYEAIEEKRG